MRKLLPVVIVAALLSGCGAAGTGPAGLGGLFARGDKAAGHGMMGQNGGPMGGRGGMKGGHGGMMGGKGAGRAGGQMGGPGLAWPGVVLSAEQQTQLQALAAKYAQAKPTEADRTAQQAKHDALNAALMAATFDAAAFKAALTALHDGANAPKAHDPQLMVEARALLTDAQRAAAIAALKALPAPKAPAERPAPPAGAPQLANQLSKALGLNEAQAAKLAALQAGMVADAPVKRDPAAERAAQIAFLETGDAASLPAKPAPKALPIDAIVDFVASLDGPQRGKLAASGLPFAGGGMRGGMGGHGGGKRGGMGGHGGGRGFAGRP